MVIVMQPGFGIEILARQYFDEIFGGNTIQGIFKIGGYFKELKAAEFIASSRLWIVNKYFLHIVL